MKLKKPQSKLWHFRAENGPHRDRQSVALLGGVGPDSNEFESRDPASNEKDAP